MLLEVAVESLADARVAAGGGADRLELCSCLDAGGLTPSLGALLAIKSALPLAVMMMIRPRAGGFCYSRDELDVMSADIDAGLGAGADGFVFGALTRDLAVDADACASLLARCGGRPAVFHRAIDLLPDPLPALDSLIGLGFARVLTSGGGACAAEPAATAQIQRMLARAAGRIEILPGGGVRAANAGTLIEQTGCRQVHGAMRRRVPARDLNGRGARLGFGPIDATFTLGATDGEQVAALRVALDRAAT